MAAKRKTPKALRPKGLRPKAAKRPDHWCVLPGSRDCQVIITDVFNVEAVVDTTRLEGPGRMAMCQVFQRGSAMGYHVSLPAKETWRRILEVQAAIQKAEGSWR